MKNNYLTLLFLFSICLGFAQTKDSLSVEEQARREKNIQAGNPFKKFGYTPKIATLSKGKYLEFHDLDSIVKIGSFSYHVKKKSVTGYTQIEDQNTEAGLSPEIISRWFSPDPLTDEFPSWSPYAFTNDNPIFFTDPTGLAPEACCRGFMTGAGIGIMFNRIKRTGQYMSEGQSPLSAYARASGDDLVEGGKQVARYVTPIEDIYGVAYGKDFDGNEYNRAEAGGWALASVIPFAKIGKLGKLGKVVVKNGDEVFKAADNVSDAFKEASRAGGKHSGMLENVLKQDMPVNEIEKSIDTYMNGKRGILTHQDKLANPEKYVKDWSNLRPQHQESLINGWKSEIQNSYEKIDILKDLLNK